MSSRSTGIKKIIFGFGALISPKSIELSELVIQSDLSISALVYAAFDDFDNAFKVINQSLDRQEDFMFGLGNFLMLDKLKSDPRWKDVARRINLPQNPWSAR